MSRRQPFWQPLGPCAPGESKLSAVSDMSCVDGPRALSVVCERRGFGGAGFLTNSSESSGGSCGKDTLQASPARLQRPSLMLSLVSSWCRVHRTSAGRDGSGRRDPHNPRLAREPNGKVKRKLFAQPEISHEAAGQILRSQATRTDEDFPGITHVSHQLLLLHGHANVFFLQTVWCRQRWRDTGAAEVSVRRDW